MAVKFGIIFIFAGICRTASQASVVSGPETDYRLFPDNNRWYKLHKDLQDWATAEQTCIQEGGHLAVLDSVQESNYLTQLMLEGLPDLHTPTVLLGFNKGADGKFVTVDGKTLEDTDFHRWSNTGPEYLGLKGGNCGSLHRDGGLSRISCQQPAPSICERDSNAVVPTTTSATTTSTPPSTTTTTIPPQPFPGYKYLPDLGWYKVYEKKKWHEAKKKCEEDGTHLAILNSQQEANALTNLMSSYRGRIDFGVCSCAFIGFHDLSREGHFTTVFGQPLEATGYLKWNPGNPDNTGNNEDCGSITYHGLLNDLSCVEEYPFICESSKDSKSYDPLLSTNVTQSSGRYETFPGVGAYKLHTDGKRWYEALDVCEREGAYLAIVNSDEESEVLRKMLGRNPDLELGESNAIFLGFHDIPSKEDFTTIFGDPLNTTGFTKWASKVSTNFDCGALNRNGRLALLNCFSKVPFICEQLSETDRQKRPKQPENAPSQDYEFHTGLGYYKLNVEKATWHVAKRKCEQDGAHLAIINSEEESKLLKDIASRNPDIKPHSSMLLGYHDLSTEGRFVTIFGTPIESSGFKHWREWNPDNFGGGEDCGAMDHNGLLNDVPCDLKLQFFCEKDLTSKDNTSTYAGTRRMRITPDHVHVRQGGYVSVMCEAPEPLIECHFKVSYRPVMDLSRGSASKTNLSLFEGDLTNYRYNGSGLADGQCGIVLSLASGLHRKMVGCRARGIRGGWYYAYMSMHASNAPAIRDIESAPKEVVTFEGEPVKLVWTAPSPIKTCKCIFPFLAGEIILTDPFSEEQEYEDYDYSEEMKVIGVTHLNQSSSLFHGVQYHGKGFSTGQCGIEFLAGEAWNGYLWCGMATQMGFSWRSTAIIVVKPPSTPDLQLNAVEHSEGAIFEAECRVSGSHPMPNITWYLGGEVARQDLLDDAPTSAWSWPFDEQIITQRLSRQLKLEDSGKEVTCEAANPYSPAEPVRIKKLINIGGSLLNRTFDVEEYGFEVGKPGFIVITITASPKPEIMWHFDNITIEGGKQDPSGRFVATLASKTSTLNIQWLAKLYISNVTEEDFSRDFHLTAKNEFGAQAYKVVIVRTRTTEPPVTTPTTTTTTTTTPRPTARPTTNPTTSPWVTSGPQETTADTTAGPDTTPGYAVAGGSADYETEAPVFQEKVAATESGSGWSTGGAIVGIVLAILIVHLSLAAIVIYGRRAGWSFIPRKARRHFGPAMSMDNLVDDEETH